MSKPQALSDKDLAYCRERLKNHWPWTPHTYETIASLVAMAEERNQMIEAAGKARAAAAIASATYGTGL